MSLSTYMNLCLTHPTLGYYRKADPLGRKGDFITAPEISQMFGEMLGVWVAQIWQQMDKPKNFTLAELGPARYADGRYGADFSRCARYAGCTKHPIAGNQPNFETGAG